MLCLLVGQPNSGKTTFLINFAAFMGLPQIQLTILQPQGSRSTQSFPIVLAHKMLIAEEKHTTKSLQSINITFPRGKKGRVIELVDSCGLREGIHPDPNIRLAMAQTIEKMTFTRLALHIIDLLNFDKELSLIDKEIKIYLEKKTKYCILANKIDLENSLPKIDTLKALFPATPIYPISALYSLGFKEVYNYVFSHT